jgi:tRNA (guanine-N7-)-methyltransferase
VLDAEPGLAGGPVDRWEERPSTRFERRGLDAGHVLADFAYRRCTAEQTSTGPERRTLAE